MSPPEEPPGTRDIALSDDDRDLLQAELARIYATPESVVRVLHQIGFPSELIPLFKSPEGFWSKIFGELDRGVIPVPYRRIVAATLSLHGSYRNITGIARRYEVPVPNRSNDREDELELPGRQAATTCHVIVQASDPEERRDARGWLAKLGFEPEELWSNADRVSFRLNQVDAVPVREQLALRRDLQTTLILPGEPDNLLDSLVVRDLDGHDFEIYDVPVQLKIGDLADSVVRQYAAAQLSVRRLGDATYVGLDERRTTGLDRTLAQEGISEGALLELGTLKPDRPFKVLLIGASPKKLDPVGADWEARVIRDAAKEGGHIDFAEIQNTQPKDLPQVREVQPDILHFACHSDAKQIILEDHDGWPKYVLVTTLADMLRWHVSEGTLKLSGIVLATCQGERIANYFAGVADTVIAHKKRLDANCSLLFTSYFYRELRRTPELARAARYAARDVPNDDQGCTMIVKNLIILPNSTMGSP